MTKESPTVSLTITSYNYGDYIGHTIESILQQTFTDFEIVIIDDASPDNSVEVIKKYADQDDRIRLYVNEQNKGFAQNLKDVTDAVRGKYMVHMDSDDWIKSPTALERQVALLDANPDVVFVYSTIAEYDNKGNQLMNMVSFPSDAIMPGVVAVEKAMTFYIGHSGPMFRREAFRQIGGYNLKYQYVLDLQLWFDLCALGKVGYICENLYAYRQHKESMKATVKQRQLMVEILQAVDTVFEGPLAAQMQNPAALKRHVYSHALTAIPMSLVFGNRYKLSWAIMWESIKLRPQEALINKRTAIIGARTLLRSRVYEKLQRLFLLSSVSLGIMMLAWEL